MEATLPLIRLKMKTYSVRVFGYLPFLWLAGLALLAVRARSLLGHWPTVASPDPKALPFTLHVNALSFGLYFLMGALSFGIGVYLVNSLRHKVKVDLWPLWSYIAGMAIIVVLGASTIHAYNWVSWFLD